MAVYHMRLASVTTNVDFSPEKGWTFPYNRIRQVDYSKSAIRYSYEFGSKKMWRLPVANITTASQPWIERWWRNQTDIAFYPDYIGDSGTSYTVNIINETNPLWMTRWEDKYEGELILYEV